MTCHLSTKWEDQIFRLFVKISQRLTAEESSSRFSSVLITCNYFCVKCTSSVKLYKKSEDSSMDAQLKKKFRKI